MKNMRRFGEMENTMRGIMESQIIKMEERNKHLTDFEGSKESVINLSKVRHYRTDLHNVKKDKETQQGILYEARRLRVRI